MFDDNASCRALRIEFRDAFVGGVGVVDVVVGKLLALQLSRGRHAKAFSGRAIERRALMRVLAIAQRLDQFSAEGAIVRGIVVQRVREPVRDRGIVGGGARIGFRRQSLSQLQGNHAAVAAPFRRALFRSRMDRPPRSRRMWFLAAARIIAGPPMSMFSMQSSYEAPLATVASNG